MKLTKERKIYAAVFAVAIGGFAVDRMFLGETGPAESAAALAVRPGGAAVTPSAKATVPAAMHATSSNVTLTEENSLALRLEKFAQRQQYELPVVANAFVPDAKWVAPVEESQKAKVEEKKTEDAAAQFTSRHKLMAVMSSGGVAAAIVDGKLVHTGEQVDGFTLTRVAEGLAVFEKDGRQVRLELTVNVGPRGR
jgi:hypothetical protein